MNGAILLAGLLAASPQAKDDWANAPRIKLEGQVIVVGKNARKSAARARHMEAFEVPEGPPLTAQKNPDGSITLQHKRLEDPRKAGREEPK